MRTTETALQSTLAGSPVILGPATAMTSRSLTMLAKGMTSVLRILKNRRTTAHLRDLDDRQLADIGLSRADVDRVITSAFFEDSGRFLTLTAQARIGDYYRDAMRR